MNAKKPKFRLKKKLDSTPNTVSSPKQMHLKTELKLHPFFVLPIFLMNKQYNQLKL